MRNTKYCVYIHIRNDTGLPFYVGEGTCKRPYSKQRNEYWSRVAKKHGYTVQIIQEGLTKEEALEHEWELKELLVEDGIKLTNLRVGREDKVEHSQETRNKIGSGNRGKIVTQLSRDKISIAIKNVAKFPCLFCGKVMSKAHLIQWHGSKCKKRSQECAI